MKAVFWIMVFGVFYAYVGYPLLLAALAYARPRPVRETGSDPLPTVSIIIPVHNEAEIIERKIQNTLSLNYPSDRLQIVFVSDASSDGSTDILNRHAGQAGFTVLEVPVRKGKANALNMALGVVTGDIVIFSDASIILDADALRHIVAKFADPEIGCVSGEDHIREGGGEGLYGRYELFLRNQESRIGSIVGASGSFYAQRRVLCEPFVEGVAPDFLSVLNTVERGARAVTEPLAFGDMRSVRGHRSEFQRKVRTLIRGFAALSMKRRLLNPFRFGLFALELLSHKLVRWWVPFFLLGSLVTNAFLLDSEFYVLLFALQVLFYALAAIASVEGSPLHESAIGRVPLYFSLVNLAILVAWIKYFVGVRQEIWDPSKRTA